MEIKTFDTILTGMCDSFDELISPRTMARTNTNIGYLILKAIAKGYEVINNTCVLLSNKFNPASCDASDLDSSASLTGTERYSGSSSGLRITVTNNHETALILLAGTYVYELDSDTSFSFEVLANTEIMAGGSVSYIAMSEEIGSYPVTAQTKITVTSTQTIPDDLTFSCGDNSSLLGTAEETDLEFRQRILTKTDRQDVVTEAENLIKNLPYIFDCKIKFNSDIVDVVYDGITIPPFTALVCYSGEIKAELAEKLCSKLICPTVQTAESVNVPYVSEVFASGQHNVYFTPFAKVQYSVNVLYKVNDTYANSYDAQVLIRSTLLNKFVAEVHKDYVKEEDIYNTIEELNIAGIDILGVNLIYNGNTVNYISVPVTRIPELASVTFTRE